MFSDPFLAAVILELPTESALTYPRTQPEPSSRAQLVSSPELHGRVRECVHVRERGA